jgi:hypothetical protein
MNLHDLDGFEREYLFCMWLGNKPMPKDRLMELFSIISNAQCPVIFLHPGNYHKWELPSDPFHPALKYLSEAHASDYLRAYLLHHYGGGYTDIKFTYKPWDIAFKLLKESDALGLGYPIKSQSSFGLSEVFDGTEELEKYKADFQHLMGNPAFIFKKNTELSKELYDRTNRLLDFKLEELKKYPAQTPKDRFKDILPDGSESQYPLYYIELGPDLFHQSIHKFKDKVIRFDIEPLHVFHFDLPLEGFAESKKGFISSYIPIYPRDI